MHPIFFDFTLPVLGEVTFPAYSTMIAVGFLVAVWLARREADARGWAGEKMVDMALVALVAGVAGARLLAVLTDGKLMDFVHLCTDPTKVPAADALVAHCTADAQCGYDFLCNLASNTCYPPRDCLAALKFWNGGLTYYGALIAAIPAAVWYCRRHKLAPLEVFDLAAPFVLIALAFGRLGCFFEGCCYGAPTDFPLGLTFPPSRERPGVPIHPTQLYDGAAALVLAAALYYRVRPRRRGHGEVFGWMLVGYGVWRCAVEVLRIDPRGGLGPLSTSQLLSIPMIAAGLWLIARARRGSGPGSGPGQPAGPNTGEAPGAGPVGETGPPGAMLHA
jgi:phosphatidylglycerol---prolipoprotein diacylglyceryl transferase